RGAYRPTAAGTAAMLASMPRITTTATTIMIMRAERDPGIAALPVVLELERHRLIQLPEHPDHLLELVPALGCDADRVALDPRLALGKIRAAAPPGLPRPAL